jgi:hypothetical protein
MSVVALLLGQDDTVGIPTNYGQDSSEIKASWGAKIFPHSSRQALGLTQPPVQQVPVLFPGSKAAGA